jgi:MFS superfamily sulfate permease-like transporter
MEERRMTAMKRVVTFLATVFAMVCLLLLAAIIVGVLAWLTLLVWSMI